jgi:excisionase family DNA binding protein
MGCDGEPPPAAIGLCVDCAAEGKRVAIRARSRARLRTTAEAADLLGCSEITVRRMLRDGRLRGTQLRLPRSSTGNRWLILAEDLEAFLNAPGAA